MINITESKNSPHSFLCLITVLTVTSLQFFSRYSPNASHYNQSININKSLIIINMDIFTSAKYVLFALLAIIYVTILFIITPINLYTLLMAIKYIY